MSVNLNNKIICFSKNTTCNNFTIDVFDLCIFTSFITFSYMVTFIVAKIVYFL